MSRDVMKRLGDSTLVAVSVPLGEWPRRFMGGVPIPDAWMGLVEKRDGKRWCTAAGDEPRGGEDDTLTLVRNRPIVVPIDVREGPAACGNLVGGTADVLVRWQMRDDELAALRRALLSGPDLTLQRLADAVADGGGRAAMQAFIRARTAADLVEGDSREALLSHLRAQLKKLCFETGMSIETVTSLQLGSSTLARRAAVERDTAHEIERIRARELVEHAAAAATQKRLGELGGVLEKLQNAAARGSDNMQWHELLPALSPTERGRLLESLWRITPDRHRTVAVVAAAGDECVWLDPAAPESIFRRLKLPPDLGGVRSVAFDRARQWLLVGAAVGVWAIRADSGEVAGRFSVPGATQSRTGFNSAVIAGDRLYATHSQLGCWSWALVDGEAACVLAPESGVPKTIRSACVAADGRVLMATDDAVQAYSPATGAIEVVVTADDVIHCLATHEHEVFAGVADGKLLRFDLRQPEDCWVPYRANMPIESVQARQWNDLVELVVPGGENGVCGVYGEENITTRLLETATPTRRAWASDDLIVALNDRRDRLTVMNSAAAGRSGRDVVLARVLGSSIQDACLVTTSA